MDAAAAQITAVLQAALGVDAGKRAEAEAWLKQLESQSLPIYLQLLSSELCNEDKALDARQMAGITLKNTLDAKDITTQV